MLKKLPYKGAVVSTPDGRGVVTDIATLKGEIKVKFEGGDGFRFGSYKLGEFKPLHSKPKTAEPEDDEQIADFVSEEAETEPIRQEISDEPNEKNQSGRHEKRDRRNRRPRNRNRGKRQNRE